MRPQIWLDFKEAFGLLGVSDGALMLFFGVTVVGYAWTQRMSKQPERYQE